MSNALPDMTGQEIENWIVGEKLKYGQHIGYNCTCKSCRNEKKISATDLNRKKNLICQKCSNKRSSYKEDNLTGTKQGSFLIGEAFRKNGRTYYHVTCDCGKEYDILRDNLIRKQYRNCKCHGNAVDPTKKYGMLQPLRRMEDGKWECRCDCGNICYKDPAYLLREGLNFSCGCKKKANRVKKRTDNKTGVKGVCFVTKKQKYLAYITKDGYTYRLGFFDTIQEAAEARNEKEKQLFIKF